MSIPLASAPIRRATGRSRAAREARPARKSAQPIRILIVDDHPLVRSGLASRIGMETDLEVCGEAADAESAMQQLQRFRPDVAIVDLALRDSHGLTLIKEIVACNPDTRVLVLSAYHETVFGEPALRAGALGYLNKQDAPSSVIMAIRTVASGSRYISEKLAGRLLDQAVGRAHSATTGIGALSTRELEIFQMIGQGLSTRDIALSLKISVHTVETHRDRIRGKLGLDNGAALLRSAIQWSLARS